MAVSFRYNDTTYELFSDVSVITNPSLNIAKDVAGLLYKFSVPLLTSREQTIGSYIYKAPSPTICVRHNDTTYYCARSREAVSEYDIPAGTYTPSAFRALIEQYISNNGNRTVANAFSVTVNGQTISVSANQKIYYQVNSSSPQGAARAVYFGKTPSSTGAPEMYSCIPSTGFTDGKCYVVYNSGGGFQLTNCFSSYSNYNITVGTGINFS